jgi:hypothetical protein
LASITHFPAPVNDTLAALIVHAPAALLESMLNVTAFPDAPPLAVTV